MISVLNSLADVQHTHDESLGTHLHPLLALASSLFAELGSNYAPEEWSWTSMMMSVVVTMMMAIKLSSTKLIHDRASDFLSKCTHLIPHTPEHSRAPLSEFLSKSSAKLLSVFLANIPDRKSVV